ncbi:hypothetical protein [uncultured Methanoregula sp.]|uniref:hypothetical protein n=1 Tax=uncultured Methanoregula sp. TaxID=1005933 RepID=UPI002AAA6295|nr:hypothetical protein [uncultured Methanoregula sp.]
MPDHEAPEHGSRGCGTDPGKRDVLHSAVPSAQTLESIIDMTGELEHLNELVMLHLNKTGGFKGPESYLTIVSPVLDNLETAIRRQYRPGMNRDELKLVIGCWIDREITGLR